jgi:hypothetical protein
MFSAVPKLAPHDAALAAEGVTAKTNSHFCKDR